MKKLFNVLKNFVLQLKPQQAVSVEANGGVKPSMKAERKKLAFEKEKLEVENLRQDIIGKKRDNAIKFAKIVLFFAVAFAIIYGALTGDQTLMLAIKELSEIL